MSTGRHWDAIFAATDDAELGWYEPDVSQTLKFLDRIPAPAGSRVFVPGAGTSVLVDALLARGHELILNDISDAALDRLRQRIGTQPQRLTWLHHDIARPLPDGVPAADVWVDRAVLHFLLDEADIAGYFRNLRAALRPGGSVLMAEFSTGGAPRCAGLDVHRYSLDELAQRLGPGFDLLGHEDYTFINPHGEPRPYLYALFRRSGSGADGG